MVIRRRAETHKHTLSPLGISQRPPPYLYLFPFPRLALHQMQYQGSSQQLYRPPGVRWGPGRWCNPDKNLCNQQAKCSRMAPEHQPSMFGQVLLKSTTKRARTFRMRLANMPDAGKVPGASSSIRLLHVPLDHRDHSLGRLDNAV